MNADSLADVDLQALRTALFVVLRPRDQKESSDLRVMEQAPEIGSQVVNVCCPFGISAKELFFNIRYSGVVANYVNENVGILDLNGGEGLLSVEGSPVISHQESRPILSGIRLPNLINRKSATSFSLFVPIGALRSPRVQKDVAGSANEFAFVVQVKASGLGSSGIVIDKSKGLVLTNAHCVGGSQVGDKVTV